MCNVLILFSAACSKTPDLHKVQIPVYLCTRKTTQNLLFFFKTISFGNCFEVRAKKWADGIIPEKVIWTKQAGWRKLYDEKNCIIYTNKTPGLRIGEQKVQET